MKYFNNKLRLQIAVLMVLSIFRFAAANEVRHLPALSPDTVAEPGLDISVTGLSNSQQDKVDFALTLSAFRLEHDLKIEGAHFYRGFEKKAYHTIEPFSLTIPRDSTLDSVVVMDINLHFPYTNVFEPTDTVYLDTSEGRMIVYTGVKIASKSKKLGLFDRYRSWIFVSAAIVIVLLIILMVNRNAKRLQRIRRENLAARAELSTARQHNDELNNRIDSLFGERLDAINKLCNEYFEKKDAESDSVRLSIYKEVERIILSFGSRESLDTIEATVNAYRNDILKRLREQVPSLSATDIKTITYLYAGFSPKAVCIFTDCKIKNFYNRRLRLREKIANSAAPDRDEFLSRLDQ